MIPEQSVIYLENNKKNVNSNNYEFWWRDKCVASIEVKQLKLWEIEVEDVLEHKLYNLFPVLIFKYRLKLQEATTEELEKIKDEVLVEIKQIWQQSRSIYVEITERDIDLILSVLGELLSYFDRVFFEGNISKVGEFKMTFTEEIRGYRNQIDKFRQAAKQAEEEKKQAEAEKKQAEEKAKFAVTKAKLQEKFDTAKRLLAKGMDAEFVIDVTGLSSEQIESIQQ